MLLALLTLWHPSPDAYPPQANHAHVATMVLRGQRAGGGEWVDSSVKFLVGDGGWCPGRALWGGAVSDDVEAGQTATSLFFTFTPSSAAVAQHELVTITADTDIWAAGGGTATACAAADAASPQGVASWDAARVSAVAVDQTTLVLTASLSAGFRRSVPVIVRCSDNIAANGAAGDAVTFRCVIPQRAIPRRDR